LLKAWLHTWKNIFNYSGIVSRKEYWLACIMNILAMFVFVIPYALIMRHLPISVGLGIVLFFIIFLTPAVALYFRRANDANWSVLTALFMALALPIVSGLIVGVFSSIPKGKPWPQFYSIIGKIFALGYGLFFYGGFLGIIFFDNPTAIPVLCYSGLFLNTITLVFVGIRMLILKIRSGGKDL